jgi:hypothetical protein
MSSGPGNVPPPIPPVEPVLPKPVNVLKGISTAYTASANLPNFFDFIAMISPYLVVFFVLFNSIVNSNLKGLIYMAGVIILFIVVVSFQKLSGTTSKLIPDAMCNLFHINVELGSTPSFSVALVLYTMLYLFIPMISNNVINYPFIIILSFILVLNVFYRISKKCTSMFGALTGGFLGFLWGIIYYVIVKSGDPKLTYYDDFISNKVACSRPSKQQFKCAVYKNGELLQTI